MKSVFVLVLFAMIFLFSNPVQSRDQYPDWIPNGRINSCSNCHVSAFGGGQRTPFGETVRDNLSSGIVRWDLIFNIDSDGDGFTNGEELQDADGQWAFGKASPGNASLVTKPGDPNSKPTPSSVENDLVGRNAKIYPIPSLGIVNLDYTSDYFENSSLVLFNSNGNRLTSMNVETVLGNNKHTLDMNNLFLNSGIYYLVLRNKYFNIRKRIVFSK